MKNKIDFKIPAWLVPIICNDDWTATNDADEKAAKDFFAKTYFDWGAGYWVVNEDTGFGLNDVDNFAGDTYAATYVADGFLSRSTASVIPK